ncbi:MAG TPA: MarR family transcriptional regulator [Marmoricola sp.]|jgi:DNA-binding MarR family transcriptional regulator|nr:MarR family transcriptional regulator [Marmoricola sp.]
MMATTTHTRTDSGLASQLRVSLMRLSRRLRHERQPENTLSVGAISVLGTLRRNGECTVGQLAASERVQPPSMTRTVNCLVEDGYVVRRASEHDGRQVLVDLSDKGREVLAADRRRRDAWLARQLRDLTPEEKDVLRRATPILDRLADAE